MSVWRALKEINLQATANRLMTAKETRIAELVENVLLAVSAASLNVLLAMSEVIFPANAVLNYATAVILLVLLAINALILMEHCVFAKTVM